MRIPINPPKFTDLIRTICNHNLAPTIVFLGSRRSCDESVEFFRSASISNIKNDDKTRIESIAKLASTEELEHIRRHRHYNILMSKGIAAHHAGHLPAWKHFVEKVMSAGLLRAVFSTSTLAAGINMPARSVVITASSLRTDEGHRDLKSFELAQMTGRAGRRGKDNVGFAIFIPGPFQDINVIKEKLFLPSEPIESKFNANYTMVLNLLQHLSPESARALVERSLHQFQNMRATERTRTKIEQIRNFIEADQSVCPAIDRAKTYYTFRDIKRTISSHKKNLRSLHKSLKEIFEDMEATQTFSDEIKLSQKKLDTLSEKYTYLPCSTCEYLETCPPIASKLSDYQKDLKRLEKNISKLEGGLWIQFEDCVKVLQHYGYLTEQWRPTEQGTWASHLRVDNSLFIAELLRNGFFDVTDVRTLTALCGALTAEDKEFAIKKESSEKFSEPLEHANEVADGIAEIQQKYNLFFPMSIYANGANLLWLWSDKTLQWEDLLNSTDASEGDIVRLTLRTADLLSQLTNLVDSYPAIAELAYEGIKIIRRPPVED